MGGVGDWDCVKGVMGGVGDCVKGVMGGVGDWDCVKGVWIGDSVVVAESESACPRTQDSIGTFTVTTTPRSLSCPWTPIPCLVWHVNSVDVVHRG